MDRTVEDFINRSIECYILGDLSAMSRCIASPTGCGGVCYPMLMTILSGMELLGYILNDNNQTRIDGNGSNIKYFWDNYFIEINPDYKGLELIFIRLIRNGIAHMFMTKGLIYVHKYNDVKPIMIDLNNEKIYINVNSFYKSFCSAYYSKVRPKLLSNNNLLYEKIQKIDNYYTNGSISKNKYNEFHCDGFKDVFKKIKDRKKELSSDIFVNNAEEIFNKPYTTYAQNGPTGPMGTM